MQSRINAYLSFKNNAREALEFYHSVFGGKLVMNTFKEFGASDNPAEQDLIMHGMLEAENGISFMGSDTPSFMQYEPGARISLALSGDNAEELKGYFEKLSAGGTVTMPLDKAPWGDYYGSLTDKFGINWMVNLAEKK
ncbi:hypothetical protein D3C72_263170 [compost metagenome]